MPTTPGGTFYLVRLPGRLRAGAGVAERSKRLFSESRSLGYDVKDGKLIFNEEEAKVVIDIFHRYLPLKSVNALRDLGSRWRLRRIRKQSDRCPAL